MNESTLVIIDAPGVGAGSENGHAAGAADAVRTINAADLHLPTITNQAWHAIDDANVPYKYFQRGGAFVDLAVDDDGRQIPEVVSEKRLRYILARVAYWYREGKLGQQSALPPLHVVQDMLARRDPPLPRLKGVLEAPVFLPTGRLLAQDGYDVASGYYLQLAGLTELNTNMPVEIARNLLLDELLADFPFYDSASKAHVFGALIEPFVRPLINGPTPLRLFEAPTQGSGKGLLADIVSIVATGYTAPIMSLSRGEDEIEKRITSLLMRGSRLILIDNVRELNSHQLEAALTSGVWTGRVLGFSRMATPPNTALWMATGNNVAMTKEMLRRCVSCRLDAGVENPEERSNWKHALPAWAYEHRAEIVSAILSIVRSWLAAGRPGCAATLGRYESWASIVGGIIEHAGVPGFLRDRERLRGRGDLLTAEWTAFCKVWWAAFGDTAKTAGALHELAATHNLLVDLRGGHSKLSAWQRLGHALADRRDCWFGEFAIRSAGRDGLTGNAAYRVERATPEQTPETPEMPPAAALTPGVSGVSGVPKRVATACSWCGGTETWLNPGAEPVCTRCHPEPHR